VHGYEQWGIEGLLGRINGMFAFALHDIPGDRIFLARDRLGIKPLLYTVRKERLYFASSLKALLVTGQIPLEPDPAGMRLYLHNQFIPGPFTAIAGVRKLPPASLMTVERGRAGEPERYWRLPESDGGGSDVEWREEVRLMFEDAVRTHMISDVEVGAFLSGGLDSSLAVSVMSEIAPGRVKAFSIAVKHDSVYDESPYAREAAERAGAELITVPFAAGDAAETLDGFFSHLDEPVSDPAQLPTFMLSKKAREHVKVVLSGEGADEVFAGYDYYFRFVTLRGLVKRSMEKIRRRLIERAGAVDIADRISMRLYRSCASFYPHSLPGPVCDSLLEGLSCSMTTERLQDRVEAGWLGGSGARGLDRALKADLSGWLPDNLLMKVDRMSMAHGLEVRVPFLDHRLVELGFRMPVRLKRRGKTGKVILREAFADRLGPTLSQRGKQGFDLPMGKWLRGVMRPAAEERLETFLPDLEWIDRSAVRKIWDVHMSGRIDLGRQVWLLVTLAAWFAGARSAASQ
jgi:asparagine synthase (glutamine-hydrolysing)